MQKTDALWDKGAILFRDKKMAEKIMYNCFHYSVAVIWDAFHGT